MDDQTPITVLDQPPEVHAESTESQAVRAELLTEIPPEVSLRPATLQERFAAFFTDLILFSYLVAGWALLLQYLTRGNLAHPFQFKGAGRMLFLTTTGALHFLYFFFFEGVLTATPGKMLGGLSIRKKEGGSPSLFSILLRNLMRLVDYPLLFVTGIGLIEATHRHQRLGDLIARTLVVREIPFEGRRIDPEKTSSGGATRRTVAFLFDLFFVVPFIYGLLLLIPADRALVSLMALNLVPAAALLYLTLTETLFQTTCGKALLGLKVTQEDGRPPTFATVLVRNAFRIFDMNPLGYLCAALSSKNQRPGDIAAGTLVLRDRKGFRGWLSLPFMIVLAASVATLGVMNPKSFLAKGVRMEVAGHKFQPVPLALRSLTLKRLQLENLEFGFNEEEVNRKALYDAGDVIYLLATISGYSVRNNRAWVQGDIKVRDSKKNIILDRLNIINASLPVGGRKSARLATRFALHAEATPGRYEVLFTLRDLFGNTKLTEKKFFTVRP